MAKSDFFLEKQIQRSFQVVFFLTNLPKKWWLTFQLLESPCKGVSFFSTTWKNLMDILARFFLNITMNSTTLLYLYAFKLGTLAVFSCFQLRSLAIFSARYMNIAGFSTEEYFQTWNKILSGLPNQLFSHNCQTA